MTIFTADVGQRQVHIYDSGSDIFYGKLPPKDLIDLNVPGLQQGDIFVVEDAHLRESHKYTRSQLYSYEQLVEFKANAEEMGVTILLFPQKSTPKARKLAGVEAKDKTDEKDTKAIAQLLIKDPKILPSLKTFVPTRLADFQEKNQSIFDYIQQSNDDINPAKSSEYGFGKIDYEDAVSKWIKTYALRITEYLNGDEELMAAIGLEFDKKGKLKTIKNPNRIYTLVHSILRPNGELRIRPDVGKVPHWQYIKAHYLGCKPYHMKQGVAASNYKHWMRRAISEYKLKFQVGTTYEEYFAMKKARNHVDKMTQQIWYALRKMIVEDGLR